ncbi:DeoR/GlpR transcriptional regulator [Listeria monocytogenes]|uniref:DeoR/GlpR family DNA-binding transcription regulator n=1 Tax=Listeria monocytogenes TaxID=1639 RepID=UPI00074D6CFD|nr:DeoR/GlpR family DNA-binding transcription regulator [Listeria monocytogenes]EAG9790225.1 DeoR/GlpR transcriptional regulator [Listeria monocytogenes]EAH0901992.1 DeoR/GlpR transcriptional regulator [Listeria monocytogenes]EAH2661489.1 DeoR/GlpR transcriptional regulator [Listeria monocytogenes]EIT8055006.1 DeoR/GlpR transcriptional regulator [Listeria monocytogenes]CUL51972.1 Transcriptional regulator [Listeria monocytogenes]
MFPFERQNKIIHLLDQNSKITVPELSRILDVSISTIRNDLSSLEESGMIKKVHGGAVLLKSEEKFTNFNDRIIRNIEEKEAIAKEAATLVKNNQTIILDASSTALALAKELHGFSRLTVITSGLYTAIELKDNPNISVILTGGIVTTNSFTLEGILGANLIENIHADLCFMSAKGFTIEEGLTDFNIYETELKRLLAKRTNKLIALLDHTKMGVISTASITSAENIDLLITDNKINKALYKKFQDAGLPVKVAE